MHAACGTCVCESVCLCRKLLICKTATWIHINKNPLFYTKRLLVCNCGTSCTLLPCLEIRDTIIRMFHICNNRDHVVYACEWTKLYNAQVCSVAQSRRNNTYAANLFPHDNTYDCISGQQFHWQGDLTWHRHYYTMFEDNSLLLRAPL